MTYEMEVNRSLKTFTIFELFVKLWQYNIYEIDFFFELADNGLLGCTVVVVADS